MAAKHCVFPLRACCQCVSASAWQDEISKEDENRLIEVARRLRRLGAGAEQGVEPDSFEAAVRSTHSQHFQLLSSQAQSHVST